jgi:hypothetical protein
MSFLELARAAEQRLFGPARKERKENFIPFARLKRENLPCEESGESEKRAGTSYAFPWPDEIEGLGHRHIKPFTPCDNCGVGTWVFYGPWALCLRCANLGRAPLSWDPEP